MITAVDTNVLLDIFSPDAIDREVSERLVSEALELGATVVCDVVYVEAATRFESAGSFERMLLDVGLERDPFRPGALTRAAEAWRAYTARRPSVFVCPICGEEQSVTCQRCGNTIRVRQHLVADFLVGAHAVVQADRLLTRDRGFFARYFPELRLG